MGGLMRKEVAMQLAEKMPAPARAEREKRGKDIPLEVLAPDCNCRVLEDPDGGGVVVFRIPDAVTMRRLTARAGTQDLAMHLWESLLKRAVSSYVY